MSTTAAPAATPRRRLRVSHVALALAAAAALLLVLGPMGWRAGWWHYRFALRVVLPGAGYCGVAAAGLSLVGLLAGRRRIARRGVAAGFVALATGAAVAYVPWHFDRLQRTLPRINDITTDWINPPGFEAVMPQRAAEAGNSPAYPGAAFAELQQRAYPDIAPAILDLSFEQAFTRALNAASRSGWAVVAVDGEAGRIEATERSLWFGFTDDIVIRISPAGAGARIDIRSASRHGRGDLGVNATRIRRFLAALRG